MERKKSRWSFRKKAKVRECDSDYVPTVPTEKTVSNHSLAVAEVQRLTAENTRLRQLLEFKDYFTGNSHKSVEREDRPTVVGVGAGGDFVTVIQSQLANIQRKLERHLSLCEDRNNNGYEDEIGKLGKITESLTEILKDFTSSTQNLETLKTNPQRIRPRSDLETITTTVNSRCSNIEKVNHLLVNHTHHIQQKFEMMEDLLAKEMQAMCAMQQKVVNTPIPDRPQIKKMPANIKALAWRLQSYMVTLAKVKDFGRHLELEPDLINKLDKENQHSLLDVFWSLLCCWCEEHGDNASVDLLQQSCANANLDVLSRGLMPPSHRHALEMTITEFEDDLFPSPVVSHLRSKGILGANEVYYVTSQATRRDRVTALISQLPLFGAEAFDVFLRALVESGHSHLAAALKDNLAKCSNLMDGCTSHNHGGRQGLNPVDTALNETTIPCNSGQLDVACVMKSLANLVASSKHTESMVITMLDNSNITSQPGSQRSTLSRSDYGTLTSSGRQHMFSCSQ